MTLGLSNRGESPPGHGGSGLKEELVAQILMFPRETGGI